MSNDEYNEDGDGRGWMVGWMDGWMIKRMWMDGCKYIHTLSHAYVKSYKYTYIE
jgi:hypothetical protein